MIYFLIFLRKTIGLSFRNRPRLVLVPSEFPSLCEYSKRGIGGCQSTGDILGELKAVMMKHRTAFASSRHASLIFPRAVFRAAPQLTKDLEEATFIRRIQLPSSYYGEMYIFVSLGNQKKAFAQFRNSLSFNILRSYALLRSCDILTFLLEVARWDNPLYRTEKG